MKNTFSTFLAIVSLITVTTFSGCANKNTLTSDGNIITFYEVPLVCGAAPEIGCGSRIKPFFIDTDKEKQIKESWSNREGTIIGIIWDTTATDKSARENLIQPIFKKHSIDAKLISDKDEIAGYMASMKKDQWYEGMAVDSLSREEAGVIAEDLTKFALDKGLINEVEKQKIKNDLEEYFKKELVIVRTCNELKAPETQERWRKDGYQIYVTHIGKERADSVSSYYAEYEKMKEEKCKKDGKKSSCEEECAEKK